MTMRLHFRVLRLLDDLSKHFHSQLTPKSRNICTRSSFTKTKINLKNQQRSVSQYEPGSKSRRQNQINFDSLGTWNSKIDLPLQVEASIAHGVPIPRVLLSSIGLSSVRGRRPTQEDQFGVEFLRPNLLYAGIFDGHGGSTCARFAVTQLPRHLLYWIQAQETKGILNNGSSSKGQGQGRERDVAGDELDLNLALHNSFLELNNAFARWLTFNRKEDEVESSGSTATVILLLDSINLFVGHVGDSRAILCRGVEARTLSIDHKPDLVTEKTRIEKSGGRVSNSRVNDRLAMSRSLGDLELKRFGVTALPDIRFIQVSHSRDAFLVLTTDGINSVMSDQEIVDMVRTAEDPTEAAHLLTDSAVQYSSEDNSTAIVIPLGAWGKSTAAATMFHSFGKSFSSSRRFAI